MTIQPDIIITSLDLERLEVLLSSRSAPDSLRKLNLEEELERATVVDSRHLPENVVSMNSTVQLSISSSETPFYVTLVYPKDIRDDGSTLSIFSPIGTALLGMKQGDEIYWPNPSGKNIKVRVENILYQPERAGEYNR
ncbi:MAG: nucleoside diphosphate kinase regulator [Alteromonadaceae bacterium]|jgi:regulator of nucleoside diphosphate kinase|uniref:nucleoside diphosphate kinase regulator n=1 Tax=unclassified Methylophaga TaxID=2629249 RepID=UPI000C489DC1|nr:MULTISPECIES: nucleoside diphosphate kinase regulator [unclassified Methylophaga]MAP28078.1 nucleoside diphosphate kinase regulator [Methylophaga sp.]MBN26786.1 nucleoside diphosphate kinase regulator [Alteromonadaceae bacterium]|tara:strand:+ start:557 stop:970 length:414 start_codon:yes stop_codon:yes gene_type:complete